MCSVQFSNVYPHLFKTELNGKSHKLILECVPRAALVPMLEFRPECLQSLHLVPLPRQNKAEKAVYLQDNCHSVAMCISRICGDSEEDIHAMIRCRVGRDRIGVTLAVMNMRMSEVQSVWSKSQLFCFCGGG